MRSIVPVVLAAITTCGCGTPDRASLPRAAGDPSAVRFASSVAEAMARGDAAAVAAQFAPGAHVELIGDRERDDVAAAVRAIGIAFTHAHIEIGRTWIDRAGTTAVIELVFSARARADANALVDGGEHDVAVAGAAVVTFRDERATDLRLYLDLVTVLGQIDHRRLPEGVMVRGLEPPPAHGVFVATGAAAEAANLTLANAVWAALDAHDADRVLASASDDYRYIDYAAPKILSRTETRDMVAGFLKIATGFRIAAKPVQFAAGDFVITEMTERAAPTGKEIELHGLDIKRIIGGHVVEEWQYSNYFEVLAQIAGIAKPVLP